MIQKFLKFIKILFILIFVAMAVRFALVLAGIGGFIPYLDPFLSRVVYELNLWGAEARKFISGLGL